MALSHIIWLSLIQGITEFLPVSSSGHLNLLHALTDYPDQGVGFDVALHFGTLIAVILYFRNDVASLIMGVMDLLQKRQSDNRHFMLQILVATIPVILAAAILVLTGWIDLLRNAKTVAIATIAFAIPLYLADKFGEQGMKMGEQPLGKALLVGLAQIFALIPGASRAGVTITAARWLGIGRAEAARFSMLLSIPVILCFTLFSLMEVVTAGGGTGMKPVLLGISFSAITALASIHVFMKMTARMSFLPFVLYRLMLGAAILTVVAS
ncbi:MAG: undecaprenyl-diphosphate phosphatase [Parvibaculales bacterium]